MVGVEYAQCPDLEYDYISRMGATGLSMAVNPTRQGGRNRSVRWIILSTCIIIELCTDSSKRCDKRDKPEESHS